MEPVNAEVVLSRGPSFANVSIKSSSSDDDIPIDKFAKARTMFKDMHKARHSDSAAGSSGSVSM